MNLVNGTDTAREFSFARRDKKVWLTILVFFVNIVCACSRIVERVGKIRVDNVRRIGEQRRRAFGDGD